MTSRLFNQLRKPENTFQVLLEAACMHHSLVAAELRLVLSPHEHPGAHEVMKEVPSLPWRVCLCLECSLVAVRPCVVYINHVCGLHQSPPPCRFTMHLQEQTMGTKTHD